MEGKILDIVSHNVPFRAKIVMLGDKYGLNDSLIHDGQDPLIEFYDRRHKFTTDGQFVSRYYASTLIESANKGITLDTGSPDWFINEREMNLVKHWFSTHPLVEPILNSNQKSSLKP